MAFEVETGAGSSTANSYVAVADANTYHTDRANTAWTGADAVKQAALINATEYIDATFTWATGVKANEDQALGWPRYGAIDEGTFTIDDDVVPERVKRAVCSLALAALSGTLLDNTTRGVLSESIAGAISVSYDPNSPQTTTYHMAARILGPLVLASGTARLERA